MCSGEGVLKFLFSLKTWIDVPSVTQKDTGMCFKKFGIEPTTHTGTGTNAAFGTRAGSGLDPDQL